MADGPACTATDRTLVEILVERIDPDLHQPRDLPRDDEAALRERVADILATLEVEDGEPVNGRGIRDALKVRRGGERFVTVDGERRYHAARFAGLRRVLCEIVVLSPEEILAEQLRAKGRDLTALEVSAALVRLRDEHRLDAASIAARTGRSERDVRIGLALATAIPDAREALAAAAVTPDLVAYLGRHPVEAQREAWPPIESYIRARAPEALPLTAAVRRLFSQLPLGAVPWKIGERLARLPACEGCPKRSDAQTAIPGLDDGAGAHCLDRACYDAKAKAHAERVVARATRRGAKVLDEDDARRPLSALGLVDLDSESPVEREGKRLTWRLVLPADVVEAVAVRDGRAVELVSVDSAARAARAKAAEIDEGDVASEQRAFAKLAEIDAWEKKADARPVVRPPSAPEPPKPAKPGSADERQRKASRAEETKRIAAVRQVYNAETPIKALALAALRIVSSDAACFVAEMLDRDGEGAGEGSPAEIITEKIDSEDDAGALPLLAALLAAELLTRGGELAELPGRWAGAKVGERRDEPPAAPSVESRIEALRRAVVQICKAKPRTLKALRAALKKFAPEATPAEQSAAIDAAIADRAIVEREEQPGTYEARRDVEPTLRQQFDEYLREPESGTEAAAVQDPVPIMLTPATLADALEGARAYLSGRSMGENKLLDAIALSDEREVYRAAVRELASKGDLLCAVTGDARSYSLPEESGDGPEAETPSPKATRAAEGEPRSVSPEATTAPAAEPCPLTEADVARLAKVAGVDPWQVFDEGKPSERRVLAPWLSPPAVWHCAAKIFAMVEAAHPVEVTRADVLKSFSSAGDDCVDVALAQLVGARKLFRQGGKGKLVQKGEKYSTVKS